MPLEPKEVQLGDRQYTLTPLPAMRALKLAARLGKVAGPGVVAMVAAGSLNASAIPALGAMFDKLGPEEFESLLRNVLEGASVIMEGKRLDVVPNFDAVFSGRVQDALILAKEVLSLNFADAFSALAAAVSAKDSTAASASSSTKN